ncbi:unnamed protein product, partial [Dovyalis caffra]
ARVSCSIWWKPKWLAKKLTQQGVRGPSYKLLLGDMKQYVKLITEAGSKPNDLTHEIVPRVDPFTLNNNQSRRKLNKEITSMMRDLIERKEYEMRIGQSNVDDLLGMLLQSNEQNNITENASGAKRDGLSTEEVIEECKQFYLAGQETTSSLLTWAMKVLAMHSEWQEKAREEVLQVCGQKEPNFEALTHLKIKNSDQRNSLEEFQGRLKIN